MKKTFVLMLCLTLILSSILTGCHFPTADDEEEATEEAATEESEEQEDEETSEETVETEETVKTEETATEEATVEVTHTITPSEPGWVTKYFYDTDSSIGYVSAGDDFTANLFERPFTESEMVYRPDIDIYMTEISSDDNYYFVSIYLNDINSDGGLQGIYGVEIDSDRDGRGDLLVIADHPTSTSWDITGVSVHTDPNSDVGGSTIMRPDSGYSGDGYENVVFSSDVLDDPDAAFARVELGDPPCVTLAFKKSLVSLGTFVWGVWAADSLLDPALIDIHDNFTETEAGSPYQSSSKYPLAAVNLVDNTCRETYGFEATVSIPGLCYEPEPTPEPTATDVPTPEPGTITGVAFDDSNNDGDRDSGEPLTIKTVTITLHSDTCSSAAINTTNDKEFSFTGLTAGTYCVEISPTSSMTTSSSYTVDVPAGGSVYVEFGYYVIR